MALTNRQSSAWHFGATTSWKNPNPHVYTGRGNIARATFAGQARIDNIGPISALKIHVDPRNTSTNYGDLYVSAAALAPNQVKASGHKVGRWYVSGGALQWIVISEFNADALRQGVGAATTWYMYWINDITSSRSLFTGNVHLNIELTHTPQSLHINVDGVYRPCEPMININGIWRSARAHININGAWKEGV